MFDSSNVPHQQRWALNLPGADENRGYLSAVRDSTLPLLRESADSDDDLYFFCLVLLHEDMHRELGTSWRSILASIWGRR